MDMKRTSQWKIFKANTPIGLHIQVRVENMMMGDLQSNPHQLGFRKGEVQTSSLSNNKEKRKHKTMWNHNPLQTPKNFVASFSGSK
jgi:hypothetical protein